MKNEAMVNKNERAATKINSASVNNTQARPMERPEVVVRVIWPRKGGHADAVSAIGRALSACVVEHTYTKPRKRTIYDNYGPEEDTFDHFTLTIKHEVEP